MLAVARPVAASRVAAIPRLAKAATGGAPVQTSMEAAASRSFASTRPRTRRSSLLQCSARAFRPSVMMPSAATRLAPRSTLTTPSRSRLSSRTSRPWPRNTRNSSEAPRRPDLGNARSPSPSPPRLRQRRCRVRLCRRADRRQPDRTGRYRRRRPRCRPRVLARDEGLRRWRSQGPGPGRRPGRGGSFRLGRVMDDGADRWKMAAGCSARRPPRRSYVRVAEARRRWFPRMGEKHAWREPCRIALGPASLARIWMSIERPGRPSDPSSSTAC